MLDALRNAHDSSYDAVRAGLAAMRRHLGMEVAYISEFVGDRSVFRVVDAPGLEEIIQVGDSAPLSDVYCEHILAGRLPELMADVRDYPLAQSQKITSALPIRSHLSVPIRRKDGTLSGMFCCLSSHANHSLNERDLKVMRVFADIAADQISKRQDAEQQQALLLAGIDRVIDNEEFGFVFQPIFDFSSARPLGFEALCRFSSEPYRSPDHWFQQAADVGRGPALELAVLTKALAALSALPDGVFLSVNASPETILDARFGAMLRALPMQRIVLEITEHARVDDYPALSRALAPLRADGVRLAIDDAGAGYASLQHIVELKPDVIKLDMDLTRAIDTDPVRRALASALIVFARETDCVLVAEGIETSSELETLKALGVPRGQGYLLGRPMDVAAIQHLARAEFAAA